MSSPLQTTGSWRRNGRRLLGAITTLLVLGMLWAGLWPFHAPLNEVTWLLSGNGLRFGHNATLLSSGRFQSSGAAQDSSCSIEIWLEPSLYGSGTLLSFYIPGAPQQFWIEQLDTQLALQLGRYNGLYGTAITSYTDDVFGRGAARFLTITSGGGQVSVYVDGALAQVSRWFRLSGQALAGELIVGDSPEQGNSWSGVLRGLAFYRTALTPVEVRHHLATWTGNGRPAVSQDERLVALYLFDEHSGRIVHNAVSSGPNLYIAQRYRVVDEAFLTPFWREFRPDRSYVRDILVNIGGFIPFGFFCCAYLCLAKTGKRPGMVTTLLGFLISLTIEVSQSFLPTRDSGTTDLITNTLGTALGVGLYSWRVAQGLLESIMARMLGSNANEA